MFWYHPINVETSGSFKVATIPKRPSSLAETSLEEQPKPERPIVSHTLAVVEASQNDCISGVFVYG